ncbi:Frizzled-4 [Geodia barretti]|uniref:Frizzled-4 n=1 Tax=Geodia barretti TaxID=519541 RepID=A0AA35T6M1_GEOBA|nr:Frizzled-4 [Geodia barretti]
MPARYGRSDIQTEANQELEQFRQLIEVNCSGAIVLFLCSIYAPFCTDEHPVRVPRPCKRLCLHVRDRCEPVFNQRASGLPWPDHLNCDQCFGPPQEQLNEVTIPPNLVSPGDTPSPTTAILLEVDYPQTGNYSYVTLTCKRSSLDGLNFNQRPATFWRGTSRITTGSQLVAETEVSISFVFNQDQEGSFSCRTALDEVSNVEKLAASPPATYNTPMMPHYILFPSLESMRKVNLSCAIQPEALKENYRVSWRRVKPTPTSYSDDTFNITVTETTEMSSIPSEYRCIVSIDHSSTIQDEDYNPPIVVVHKRVLSTLSGEIGDVSVATGEPATFVCNALKQDTSFSISWKVDSETFTCGASSENIPCYMNNETSSVLQIENTTALGVRSHVVECILQNVVPEEFRGDCVLLPRGSCDVTKSATLEISNGPTPPTVTSSNAVAVF